MAGVEVVVRAIEVLVVVDEVLLVRQAIQLVLLGHEAERLARVPLEAVPRDPRRLRLERRRRVRFAKGPTVLVARRGANDPPRHVIVRVHRVEQVGVAAVHRVVHVVGPAVADGLGVGQLPIAVKVVVLEAPFDALAHEEAVVLGRAHLAEPLFVRLIGLLLLDRQRRDVERLGGRQLRLLGGCHVGRRGRLRLCLLGGGHRIRGGDGLLCGGGRRLVRLPRRLGCRRRLL
mmetsp:Transcript_34058/g.93585  ORF Transcript_34058/g.93585 Transcript_34058/m.93585 type:complete len:231 (-) Transcript_34058:1451-2143(-)